MLRICKNYLFRIRILGSVILNYGSGSRLDIFLATEKNMLSNSCKSFNILKCWTYFLKILQSLKKLEGSRRPINFGPTRYGSAKLPTKQCCGSMTFWCGSGSFYFHHWPSRYQQKTGGNFFLHITFWRYLKHHFLR